MGLGRSSTASLFLAGLFAWGSVSYSKERAMRYRENFDESSAGLRLSEFRSERLAREEIALEGEYVKKIVSHNDSGGYDFDGDGRNDFHIIFYDGEIYATFYKNNCENNLEDRDFVKVVKK